MLKVFIAKDDLRFLELDLMFQGVNTNINLDTYQRLTSCNGLFLELEKSGNETRVKVNVNPNSSYFLWQENNSLFLMDEQGQELVDEVRRKGSKIKSDIFAPQLEGIVAIGLYNCAIPDLEKCGFCASFDYSGLKYSTDEFEAEFDRVNEVEAIKAITVNAGSLIERSDRGYGAMAPYVRILRDKGVQEINLELMPPDMDQENLQNLLYEIRDDGVTSIQFNLEVWDPELRVEVMPYKGAIPTSVYLDTITEASEVFGPGKVSSVLMAGLNDSESLREGAFAVIDAGGVPSIEPFRPLKGTPMENWSPDINYKEVIELTRDIVGELQQRYGSNIMGDLEGCLKCGGCNIY
ncbi:hypothetical protein HOG47_01340 [archaeon]|nr:hypothetical protein [archaeon]MBT4271732.1 hypothetical protein [archaeon]MBT5423443.1 hypothetical protein [archaeon]MBT6772577.1 hypothetical protein [archaeon]